ncbi:alpha/beta hydrolase, partial [Listeria monocytogenes]|nr:alpha/beta hydrolase [Listeria monocytogenes]
EMVIVRNGLHYLPRQKPKQLLQLIHSFFSNLSAEIHK